MPESSATDPVATFVDSAAALLQLKLAPDSRAEVIANLRLLQARAAEFSELPLDEGIEPAPVFRL
ncbi:MAG: DUF4089 domain-containing protein [Steroidobacteraceae bacterium]